MTSTEIQMIVSAQRAFFNTGSTLDINFRRDALKKLRERISDREEEISAAIYADLGKSSFESYMCETGLVLREISYMLRHISSFSRKKFVPAPLSNFASISYRKPSPYGVVLIMSSWNYPFLLALVPMVDALAAGNTVILKTSAYSPNTSDVIAGLIEECFPGEYVKVITGGRAENADLLNGHFDYIFFTGSQESGKLVMESASHRLTPVTLEFGGKSPCIVEKTADIRLAAKRIVFGKYLNCGQSSVAPDYIYCDAYVRDVLIDETKKQIALQFGDDPLANGNYGKIINEKHYDRIMSLIDPKKTVTGGRGDRDTLRISPTIMTDVTFDDDIMQQEIFGPVLPVIIYRSIDEAIKKLQSLPHPPSLYIFSYDKAVIEQFTSLCGFGGGCVNDVVSHAAAGNMGFGGFGESGMGAYHGKTGFNTFSHEKSIVDKKAWPDFPMRYQPYTDFNNKLIHFFLK